MQFFVFKEVTKLSDHARIYSVPGDHHPGLNYVVPEGAMPDYSIEVRYKAHTLYSGDITLENPGEKSPRPLIDVIPEGFFNTTSTFIDSESPERRSVQMRREQDDSLSSRRRTFYDFEGNKYKWHATLMKGDLTCIRVSDHVTVATFSVHYVEFSAPNTGILAVYDELSAKSLQLLLSTCMMNYQLVRRRRRYSG
ncbi:hypothetical protein FRC03_001935 [Tulasnella sp. 419]|nr:hypothetical protein FRC03_001935 [Tulasnella sp. 419]